MFRSLAAVDDIEEGKGADEELCLLPDEEEREISEAERERAMQNQQQAADEADENEQESDTNDVNLEAIEENGKIFFMIFLILKIFLCHSNFKNR